MAVTTATRPDMAVHGVLVDAAQRLRDAAREGQALPEPEQARRLRMVLSRELHDALMRARTDGDADIPAALPAVADALRDLVPDGAENPLPTRLRVLIRLLRRGDLEPAWMLAHDNASGRVKPAKVRSSWAGGSFLTTALPLPTAVEGGRVFAWLPGFRDPRWEVPDEVYAMDSSVVLKHRLDGVTVRGSEAVLTGYGYLSQLGTGPDDHVTVMFAGPSGARHRVRATRLRRPDLLGEDGPELTRLAWGGWRATVPLAPLASVPGAWDASIEVTIDGVRRRRALGALRGPLGHALPADARWPGDAGLLVRWRFRDDGQLQVGVG